MTIVIPYRAVSWVFRVHKQQQDFMENSLFSGTTDANLTLGALLFLVAGIAIFIQHEVRVMMMKTEKERYDYVNTNEIRFFWYTVIALIGAAALYLNKVVSPYFEVDETWKPYVRLFFLASFVVIAYMVLAGIVRFMYPKVIERRLSRIRNKPRRSPSGNLMRKLAESEETVHLDEAQNFEQASDVHSVEYDVWVDDKTGYKLIEKYMTSQHAEKCGECGFYTMKIHSEEIEKKPTAQEDGLMIKHFRCNYCKHREAREVVIARLASNT